MVRCVVCHNDEPVKTYEIEEPVITIGRLPENTISIANMGVSRRHVRIERDVNRNYVLTDLNSLNGTFVNNKKVKKTTVSAGDTISIGKYTIELQAIEVEQEPPPPAAEEEPAATALGVAPPGVATEENVLPDMSPDRAAATAPVTETGPGLIDTSRHTVYAIHKRVMSLGNSESDDIFVPGFTVGDAHLLVEKRDDGVWVSASKKSARFKLNGKKTSSHRLKHKDRVEVGGCVLVFMENG
jgi:predicted component of type VI protein secretion system